MLLFNYGSTYFSKFINVCRRVYDLICGFHKSKTEENKRGGKSAIQPILCCRLSLIAVSTPPSSMVFLLSNTFPSSVECRSTADVVIFVQLSWDCASSVSRVYSSCILAVSVADCMHIEKYFSLGGIFVFRTHFRYLLPCKSEICNNYKAITVAKS